METYYARNYIGALKKEGRIEKWGMGYFIEGNKEYGRKLYRDKETNKTYVIFDYDIWEFKPYKEQPYHCRIGRLENRIKGGLYED